jgi:hypothetical protein
MKARSIRRTLQISMSDQSVVRVYRRPKHATGYLEGFVVDIGTKWALLAQTRDGGWFNGWVAFRLDDVATARADGGFSDRFARTRPEWPPASPLPAGSLDNTRDVVDAFGFGSRLIGIEKERERNAIWIGLLDETWPKTVWLLEVLSNAQWLEAPLGYKLKDITSLQTDTLYMRALEESAGPAPDFEA